MLGEAPGPLRLDEIAARLEKRGFTVNRDSLESMLATRARGGQKGLCRGEQPKTFTVKRAGGGSPVATANGAGD